VGRFSRPFYKTIYVNYNFSKLFRKKVTIHYPEQVREMSPVYGCQQQLKRDEQGRENCTACGLCALSCPAEAITMKAAERKADEKHLYREEKYASIYEINMLRCIFCGLCEEACPKDAIYLTTSKVLVPSSYEREDFIAELGKIYTKFFRACSEFKPFRAY
jgi:NADH-quinone oxidoreductase subunit I